MSRSGRATLMLFFGAMAARLIWTGGFGWFVQQRMRIPLAAAAAVLLLFGLHELLRRPHEPGHDHAGHDHDDNAGQDHDEVHTHPAGPRVGWLLLLPLLVLISVAPTGLGAAAAQRVDAYVPASDSREFAPLDALQTGSGAATDAGVDAATGPYEVLPGAQGLSDASEDRMLDTPQAEPSDSGGPVAMRVYDFLDRAYWDTSRSLEGETVRLEGLVVNDPAYPDGFKLTRFMVSCCAADGIPLQVAVLGVGQQFADDTWVVADVVWRPPDVPYAELEQPWYVEADAVLVTPVTGGPPKDPYESPY